MNVGFVPSHIAGDLLPGLLGAYVALVAHEAGHVVAGRIVGFRFGILGVGPLCLARSGETLSLRWLPPSHWGPFSLAYPTTAEHVPSRLAWCVAGGPLASLLIALLAASCVRILPPEGRHFTAWLALLSACVFLATAQPFGTGAGIPSDGRRFWGLLRGDPDARSAAALVALAGSLAAGGRPRDWDGALLDLAATVREPPAFQLESATLLLLRALDIDDRDAARARAEQIRRLLPRVPRWLRADAAAEAAFWFARFEREAGTARRLLRDAGGLGEPHRLLRARAAVLVEEGDLEAARAALERARAALGGGLGPPSALDLELLDAMGRELELRRGAAG